jgi:hypothetical protein
MSICVCFATVALAAEPARQVITTRSFTGQFTAREIRNKPSPWAIAPNAMRVPTAGGTSFLISAPPRLNATKPGQFQLEADTATVSCERIKELFLRDFGLKDEWSGKIELVINTFLPEGRDPVLTGTYRPDGWSYQLVVPGTMGEELFTRTVVQSLFQEFVNRKAGSVSLEVPFWLVEGVSAHMRAFNPPTFIVRPNVQTAGALDMRVKGLIDVRSGLLRQTPLSFQQLSWPAKSDVTGPGETVYRSCALLLFYDLLNMNDGQECFRKFFDELPKHHNWQTAFLQAFHSHFNRLLDVEKWWALRCVSFTDSDLTEARTEKECWQKLQEALDVPVEVRLSATNLPTQALLTLQEVIMQWSPADAERALQRAVRNLETLQIYAFRYEMSNDAESPLNGLTVAAHKIEAAQTTVGREVAPLVIRYLTTLVNYERQSKGTGKYSSYALLKKDTVRQLNALDKEREALRAKVLAATQASGSKQALLSR